MNPWSEPRSMTANSERDETAVTACMIGRGVLYDAATVGN